MSTLFDDQVARATAGLPSERNLLPVVEKEILHHDILRIMQSSGLLRTLTFFGGTSLRLCHGSSRLSEDLDFKGGREFVPAMLERLPEALETGLTKKYGLAVFVEPPKPHETNTDTWTVRVITRPAVKDERQQRIHIDVCTLMNYERAPQLLTNYYRTDLGTSGLIVQVQSKRETYTDKLLAVAFRNRLKARDLWDLAWLRQTQADRAFVHLESKLEEHRSNTGDLLDRLKTRCELVRSDTQTRSEFVQEISRFLPAAVLQAAAASDFWTYLGNLLEEECRRIP